MQIRKCFSRYIRKNCVFGFGTVYTPRGRRTLCEHKTPDQTYNDTIRAIRAADTCESLGALVEKLQQRILKNSIKPYRNCKTRSRVRTAGDKTSSNNKSSRVENNENNTITSQYMQLAVEYYEHGFLHNIKYLESIEKHNRIKNNTQQQQQKKEYVATTTNSISITKRDYKSTTEANNNYNNIGWNTICVKITPTRELNKSKTKNFLINNKIYKSINNNNFHSSITDHNRRKKYLQQQYKEKDKNYKINNEHFKSNNNKSDKLFIGSLSDFNENSMNDFLNSNYSYACLNDISDNISSSSTSTSTNNSSLSVQEIKYLQQQQQQYQQQQQQQLNTDNEYNNAYALIADLNNLEISASSDNDFHLPKITLTDYCTHNNSEQQQQKQSLNVIKSREIGASFMLKPTQFNDNSFTNLDIPNEQNYYNSEARPP